MKPSNVQTPRPSLRARSRETLIVSAPKRSDANSSDMKPPKIVAKCLSSDFSAVSDELSPDPSETKSVVDDPSESTTISPSLAPSEAEESEIHESGDRDGEVADSDAIEKLKKMGEDAAADPTAVIRLQQALMEIGRSPVEIGRSKKLLETLVEVARSEDLSRGSRKLLDALADISLRDSCAGSRKRSGPSNPIFWAKVRVATLCFLIVTVAILNAFIASKVRIGNGTDFTGLPPT